MQVADSSYFHPTLAATRQDTMTEVEYIRQIRLGHIPWQSKADISAQLLQAQKAWTSRNMLTVAKLFVLSPEGSTRQG